MKAVTSFSQDGYKLYGKKFLETYVEHHDVPIVVYHENEQPEGAEKKETPLDHCDRAG